MPTQLRLFSTNGSENFSRLEKEVNDWLTARGDGIQPVNSQTATCAIANGGGDEWSQAVVIALWYLDPRQHASHWRNREEEARTLADMMHNEDAKERLLRIADEYARLAERAEAKEQGEKATKAL